MSIKKQPNTSSGLLIISSYVIISYGAVISDWNLEQNYEENIFIINHHATASRSTVLVVEVESRK